MNRCDQYLARIQVSNAKIADDVYKFARRFEHARDLFVRGAHKTQRIKEGCADEVVPVHLWSSDFMPH